MQGPHVGKTFGSLCPRTKRLPTNQPNGHKHGQNDQDCEQLNESEPSNLGSTFRTQDLRRLQTNQGLRGCGRALSNDAVSAEDLLEIQSCRGRDRRYVRLQVALPLESVACRV